jgi:phosphoribosylanthranilate isomerase
MTKVKICGITNLDDALFAANCGADALGFNFYKKSPRYISPNSADEIVKQLPNSVLRVGVFVNETRENIAEIASTASLDAVQLHGDESPEFVKALKGHIPHWIIKAFRVPGNFDPQSLLPYGMDTILLDAYSGSGFGGTGETFNWEIARQAQKLVPHVFLAGGLSPENVAGAIRSAGPYGVDACSCLERGKGLKDNIKVKAFIEAVKGVE